MALSFSRTVEQFVREANRATGEPGLEIRYSFLRRVPEIHRGDSALTLDGYTGTSLLAPSEQASILRHFGLEGLAVALDLEPEGEE